MSHPARHHRATRPRRTAATWPPTRARHALALDVLAAVGAGLSIAAVTLAVALLAVSLVTL